MLVAIGATWIEPEVVHHLWIVLGIACGVALGIPLSRVPLTAVPQRTALSHAFGGAAAGLVGVAYYYLWWSTNPGHLTPFRTTALITENILGFLTFTGSLMAAGKLQEVKWIPQRPVTYKGQNIVNMALLIAAVAIGIWVVVNPTTALAARLFPVVIAACAALRHPADHPDRRRRHADRDCDPELLRRAVGVRAGLRASITSCSSPRARSTAPAA